MFGDKELFNALFLASEVAKLVEKNGVSLSFGVGFELFDVAHCLGLVFGNEVVVFGELTIVEGPITLLEPWITVDRLVHLAIRRVSNHADWQLRVTHLRQLLERIRGARRLEGLLLVLDCLCFVVASFEDLRLVSDLGVKALARFHLQLLFESQTHIV